MKTQLPPKGILVTLNDGLRAYKRKKICLPMVVTKELLRAEWVEEFHAIISVPGCPGAFATNYNLLLLRRKHRMSTSWICLILTSEDRV